MEAFDPEGDDRAGQPASAGAGRHAPALDGLRGVAVIMVVVFHVFQGEALPAQSWAKLLYLSSGAGQTGVELFFVLSGFLITGILYDMKGKPHYFRNFYARRTLRIFPLYYGGLVVAFVALPLLQGSSVGGALPSDYDDARSHQVWLWTYTANLAFVLKRGLGCFDHFWTLSIEEQFYLLWPLVVVSFSRKALMRVCGGMIGAALLFRLAVLPHHLHFFRFTLCQIDALVLGSLLALVARGPRGLTLRAGTMAALLAPYAAGVLFTYIWKPEERSVYLLTVKPTLLALLYGLVLILAVGSPASSLAGRLFTRQFLRSVGKYSYAVYVLHPFVIDLVWWAFATLGLDAVRPSAARVVLVKLPAVLSISLLLAYASWNLYESKFIYYKKFFDASPDTWPVNLPSIGVIPGGPSSDSGRTSGRISRSSE